MSDNVKKSALKQAEESYVSFIKFGKYLTLGSILFFLAVAKCNLEMMALVVLEIQIYIQNT